jgi:hypothetical protein
LAGAVGVSVALAGACSPNPYGVVPSEGGAGGDDAAKGAGEGGPTAEGGATAEGGMTGEGGVVAEGGSQPDGGGHPPDGGDGGGYGPIGMVNPTSGFFHPGVVVTQGALSYVRDQAAAGNAPWKAALDALKASPSAMLPVMPSPHATVYCGSHSAGPPGDTSCADEKSDSLAAYTHALLWYFTNDDTHAKAAVAIMNAWSMVTTHSGYGGADNSPLECGWIGSVWPRAAEIVRYTYGGWTQADAAKFAQTLMTAYYPYVQAGAGNKNGNWELSTADAAIQIGVFADDKNAFARGVALWKQRMPSYFYLTSDGSPDTSLTSACSGCGSDGWWGIAHASGLVDGVSQETCRDLEHVQYGIGAAVNAAETAKIQGTDLYGDPQTQGGKRLAAAMEFHAGLLKGRTNGTPDISDVTSGLSWLTCQDGAGLVHVVDMTAAVHANVPVQPTWEIGYNELANRSMQSLPDTLSLLMANRPLLATHHLDWETVTNADVGSNGMP